MPFATSSAPLFSAALVVAEPETSANTIGRRRRITLPVTPQFSGGALTYVSWHFIHDRPLHLLV
jgi:hypothetical protein